MRRGRRRAARGDDWANGNGGFAKIYGDRLANSSLLLLSVITRWLFLFMVSQADAFGRYRCASIAVLARAAAISEDDARKAVAELEAPDPDSTTKLRKGRRIVRIPGGWQIVTYSRYREFRTARQIRRAEQKRRERARAAARGDTSRDIGDMSPMSPSVACQRADVRRQKADRPSTDGRTERPGRPARVTEESAPAIDSATRRDGRDASRSSRTEGVAEETAAAIDLVAADLTELRPDVGREGWIARCSRIEADHNGPAKSFSDPHRPGISEAWARATLARMRDALQEAQRPVPL